MQVPYPQRIGTIATGLSRLWVASGRSVKCPRMMPRHVAAALPFGWLVACGPVAPQQPAIPAAFSCESAPASLGHASARLIACEPLPHLPEIVQVALEEPGPPPARLSFTVHVEAGVARPSSGGPELAAFLDALPPERRVQLTLADVNGLLRAFSAFPEPFGPRDWNFDLPDVGRSSFTPTPFALVLYTAVPPPPEKVPNEPALFRGVLSEEGGALGWVISERSASGVWEPGAHQPLAAEAPPVVTSSQPDPSGRP